MNAENWLHTDKADCCGCGACRNACPTKAISLVPDEDGFLYPEINLDLCVKCHLCIRVCAYQKETDKKMPGTSYAATSRSAEILRRSSSGGMFAALAKAVLLEGGKVYGAAYVRDKQGMYVAHVGIDSENDIWRLTGSKYVQSDIALTYQEAERDLKAGKKVLFSGTPCQIDGLKGYLRKEYELLYTVDIICHGVPSRKHFDSYVRFLEKRYGGRVERLEFRDKSKGWSDFYLRVDMRKGKRLNTKWERCRLSAYYTLFINGSMYRENCYSCKYACGRRCSDITLGDYWGVEKEHPELFGDEKWQERLYDGISCVLINSERGKLLVDAIRDEIDCVSSTFEKVSRNNGQLRKPVHQYADREMLLSRWREGYEKIDEDFRRAMGWRYYKHRVIGLIKPEFKYRVRRMLRKL